MQLPEVPPMKLAAVAVIVASALPLAAQQTGVAHPPEVVVDDSPVAPAQTGSTPKPSAAIPMTAPTDNGTVTTYQSPAVTLKTHDLAALNQANTSSDPDANIVTEVPSSPHELSTGTLIRMRLQSSIETASTAQNTAFSGEISDDIEHYGRVVIPAGAVLHGRITEIRGGRRIAGAAAIHLEPHDITLPDGTEYLIRAAVVDTDQYGSLKINSEGTLVRKDHAKETLAAMSLATGGAAAAGAVIGGGVGALVGAGLGAGVSTIWWLKQDLQTHLPKGSLLIWSLTEPMEIESLVREPDYAGNRGESAVEPAKPTLKPRAVEPSPIPQSFVPTN